MGWVIAPRLSRFTPGKDPLPIEQEAGWAPGPVWTGCAKKLHQPGFEHRTVQPVASPCTDYAIPATVLNQFICKRKVTVVGSTEKSLLMNDLALLL